MDYRKTFRDRLWHRLDRWPVWKKGLAGIAVLPLIPVIAVAGVFCALACLGWKWIEAIVNPTPPSGY